ncbi:MAG: hypothetical protein M3513_04655 [Actinomycetota bacterium]|nr:hypothetical protein [Actinomycetota bacterium]
MYFPGLGVVDLASAALGLPDRDEYVSMRSGYGLVVGFLLPVALFTLARQWSYAPATPRTSATAITPADHANQRGNVRPASADTATPAKKTDHAIKLI